MRAQSLGPALADHCCGGRQLQQLGWQQKGSWLEQVCRQQHWAGFQQLQQPRVPHSPLAAPEQLLMPGRWLVSHQGCVLMVEVQVNVAALRLLGRTPGLQLGEEPAGRS